VLYLIILQLNEDCLVLNVHVPRKLDLSDPSMPPSDKLPIMVYIHSGSLISGAGTSSLYDGRYLSNKTNTIVVTINYRLGITITLSYFSMLILNICCVDIII